MSEMLGENRGITHPEVLAAMLKVQRQHFVPPDQIQSANDDRPLSIGFEQTISQPYMVGLMTDLLEPESSDCILEIGTGSGYQTAILSLLVKHVYSVEIIQQLADQAAERLARLNYQNITLKTGDGFHGWPEHAPFDGIIVTAAPRDIPPQLITQLKIGARLVIPLGAKESHQELYVAEKNAAGKIIQRAIVPVRFVPLTRLD